MWDSVRAQVLAHRQPSLTAADDQHLNLFNRLSCHHRTQSFTGTDPSNEMM
jgi:hypothetical protein